jgi:arylsulfatase A-like enzyme
MVFPQPIRCILAALLLTAATALAQAEAHPNVIIIYGDDVGYGDLGVYGADKIPTPNLDRMAAEGLRFTDAHCAAATCTPSRYSLLTGEMAFRKDGTGILPGDAKMAIDPDQFTVADLFKQANYATGVVGKWHLGLGDGVIDWNGEVAPGPRDIGFDYAFLLPATNDRVPCVYVENGRVVSADPGDPVTVSYGKPVPEETSGTRYPNGEKNPEAMTYYPSSHGHNNSVINGIGRIGYMTGGKTALWDDEAMADVFVDKARAFITKHLDQPFFLFFSSQDIHVPRAPHPRFHGKSELSYRGDAMVQLDWATGAILDTLKEQGLDENTIVVFTSDNGPVYDDGYEDGTTVHTSREESDRGHDASGPFRGGKYQIYEGGTRVPFIIRWPKGIKPGVSDALLSQVDLLASFGHMLEQTLPENAARDSRNHLDAMLGKEPVGAPIILEQARNELALRKGPWKYIGPRNAGKKGKRELYNLADDVGETTNLRNADKERTREMADLLDHYRKNGLRP